MGGIKPEPRVLVWRRPYLHFSGLQAPYPAEKRPLEGFQQLAAPETETPSLATTTGLRHREQAAGLGKLRGFLHLAIIITPTYSDHGQHQAPPDISINVSIDSHQVRLFKYTFAF